MTGYVGEGDDIEARMESAIRAMEETVQAMHAEVGRTTTQADWMRGRAVVSGMRYLAEVALAERWPAFRERLDAPVQPRNIGG